MISLLFTAKRLFYQVHITLYYNYIPKKMWGLQSIKNWGKKLQTYQKQSQYKGVFCVTYRPYLSLLKPNVDFVKELFCAKKVSSGLKQAGETPANPILTKTSKLQDGWSLRVCLARLSGYTCVNYTNDKPSTFHHLRLVKANNAVIDRASGSHRSSVSVKKISISISQNKR